MGDLLDAVCLALHTRGPMTLNELHFATRLPYTTLRYHLRVHYGERYAARLTWRDGLPVRTWSLVPPQKEAHDSE